MKMYEFKSLDEDNQANAVWAGTFLDVRIEGELYVMLYFVDEIYVEVFYSPLLNAVISFQPFKSTNPLLPYLQNMVLHI
jgi:hypothetical protein